MLPFCSAYASSDGPTVPEAVGAGKLFIAARRSCDRPCSGCRRGGMPIELPQVSCCRQPLSGVRVLRHPEKGDASQS
jgi:hypothetical protein